MSARKLTNAQFLERARSIHGNVYTYPSEYSGSRNFITVVCPTHGAFNVRAYSHLGGTKCRECDVEQRAASNTLTHELFLSKAKQKHHNKYTYPARYVHSNQPLEIVCAHHGSFYQLPYVHLLGNGCRLCANEQITGGYTEEWFNADPSRFELRGTLYVLAVGYPEAFFKLGITRNLEQRLTHYPKTMEYTPLSTIDMLLYDAFRVEQHILMYYEAHKYYPSYTFAGHTECFTNTFPVKDILANTLAEMNIRSELEAN